MRMNKPMKADTLIRSGVAAPLRSKPMGTVTCSKCGEQFVIIHQSELANADRAKKQSARYAMELAQEHADERFKYHDLSYDGLADE